MADAPADAGPRQTRSLRFARWVVRNRGPVALLLCAISLFFLYPILNTAMLAIGRPLPGPIVRIDTDPRDLFPDHAYIRAQDRFGEVFGGTSTVAVAVTVVDGTIFTPERLQVIREVTRRLDGGGFESHTNKRRALRDQLEREQALSVQEIRDRLDREYPPYPVNHDQVSSIAHPSARVVELGADGSIATGALMEGDLATPGAVEQLRQRVRENAPLIFGRLVSRDEKGALITAGFVTDRLSNARVYEAVFDHVQQIKRDLESEEIQIHISGDPILTGWVLAHAFEITRYVIAAILLVFALLWLYFRRWHGVLIPALSALMTVIWGLGFAGWMGIPFDPLILVIPMIITARAVSHTVQMAERFFENYEQCLPRLGDPALAKVEAATVAMGELIVPGTLGVVTDVAGLLVVLLTTIPLMQNLGIVGAFWVVSIIATVEILHPVMICYLPPPTDHRHFVPRFMVRFTKLVGDAATHPRWKYAIAGVTVALFAGSSYVALTHSTIGEAAPGTPLLWPDHAWNRATAEIGTRFGGVDSLVVFAEGSRANANTDARPIKAMEGLERHLRKHTDLGASASLVPILRDYWMNNHYGDPKWRFIPDDSGSVRAMIFQLRQGGAPGLLRPYITDDGKLAAVSFFYPDHKGETIERARNFAEQFIEENPLGEISIRLDRDEAPANAGFFDRESWIDIGYYMLGPILPPRHHTLTVRVRQADGSYRAESVQSAVEQLPDWIDQFRRDAVAADRIGWPDRLAGWSNADVDYWWENTGLGIRAVAVHGVDLLVADLKDVNPTPAYQSTGSWTRGVRFVMAGGNIGLLAAINEEVERSHVANIALIFFVIFTLHSITYRSIPSGGIILLQVATATMVSLAYMAARNVGLNVNTLPVQAVGVGIGVDYAFYIVDRFRQEAVTAADLDQAIRRAIRTTGMAVTFTATTIVGGIALWMFSTLRFQAEMAQLLVVLMVINMLGAITIVPAFYSIFRPKVATRLRRNA
jgi:predicted RND superfamily exporter protein